MKEYIDKLSMEGLSYAISKDRTCITVMAGDERAEFWPRINTASVHNRTCMDFDTMLEHMRRARAQSLC